MKRVVTLLLIAVALTGCQKARNSTRVSTGSGVRSHGLPGGSTSTPSGVQLSGSVTTQTTYQREFEEGVRDVLEAQVARDYIGSVAADASNGTGVFIGGRIELQNGQRIGASNGQIAISQNSELLLAVFDSFYTQQKMDAVPPIYLKTASGYVAGNNVYVKFWDQYGEIELEGQFNNQTFTGKLKYNTIKTFDGYQGERGTLGQFSLPTCQIFRCN